MVNLAAQAGVRYSIDNPDAYIHSNIISEQGKKELLPMQPGDVYQPFADVSDLEKDFGFKPATTLEQDLGAFAKWYKNYRK